MAESLADWLGLRESVDHQSRSLALTRAAAAALPDERPLRIVDLGSGTGSNIRYLAPQLPSPQEWLAVDRDASLTARAQLPGAVVETRTMDLGQFDDALIADAHLVTASALLDLVSERWLRELAAACRRHGAIALFALTYNGRSSCDPAEPEDEHVRALFNRHQRANDKGFGRAAGPDAVDVSVSAFRTAGYHVETDSSDWHLTPEMGQLQSQLIDGWAEAASDIAPDQSRQIAQWRARRLSHVDAGGSTIVVGHDDLVALLS